MWREETVSEHKMAEKKVSAVTRWVKAPQETEAKKMKTLTAKGYGDRCLNRSRGRLCLLLQPRTREDWAGVLRTLKIYTH